MASFSGPKLSNRIADDVPDIQAVLSSLAKLTPDSGNTDYPIGTKRVAETTNGYEFQQYNGTGWVTLEKWNLDAQKVDGYSASTGTTANTIPVRNANGKLPGDILGNAATATKATALSDTNPIATGGTGATTAEQARANLGTPPKTHASTSTEYGTGTSTQYGHLKSHDAPDSTLAAGAGHAFSPAGAAAMQDVLEGQIGDLAGVVSGNAASQATKDAQQDAAISAAQSSADAKVSALEALLRDLIEDEKATLEAQIQNTVPAGTVVAFAANSVPEGFLLCNGAAVSRTTYAVLFSAIGTTYGAGDGSSTFNLPNLTDKFIQGSGTAGKVKAAGLPNVYMEIAFTSSSDGIRTPAGFNTTPGTISDWVTNAYTGFSPGNGYSIHRIGYNAAEQHPDVYGQSTTVQPPALTMRYYIKY